MLVDPADPDAIAHGIKRVLTDAPLRDTLVARGFARAEQFCWDTTGRLTDQVIRELIDRPTVPVRASQTLITGAVRATAIMGSAVSERLMKGFLRGSAPSPVPQA